MLKIIIFQFIIALLMSCYSYKNVKDNSIQLSSGSKYKVKLINGSKYKIKILDKSDSIIYAKTEKGLLKEINIIEIQDIQERRFSYFKTIGLAVSIPIVIIGVAIVTYTPKIEIGEIRSPN